MSQTVETAAPDSNRVQTQTLIECRGLSSGYGPITVIRGQPMASATPTRSSAIPIFYARKSGPNILSSKKYIKAFLRSFSTFPLRAETGTTSCITGPGAKTSMSASSTRWPPPASRRR